MLITIFRQGQQGGHAGRLLEAQPGPHERHGGRDSHPHQHASGTHSSLIQLRVHKN